MALKPDEKQVMDHRTTQALKTLDVLAERLKSAGPDYDRDMFTDIDMEAQLNNLVFKAHRARAAISKEKRIDEVKDLGNYCVLILSKILEG